MEKKMIRTTLISSTAVLMLFVVQVLSGKTGSFVASLFSYERVDPYNTYARISVHHFVQMIIAIAIIIAFSLFMKVNFNLGFGDRKKGLKYLTVFTLIFGIVTIIIHVFMYFNNQLPTYDFPLNIRNILGTLGFQLFLSGPSEEILYRALPVTLLTIVFGKSIKINRHISLEVILASILFAIAHIKWSLIPFTFKADYFQVIYAFAMGTIQGVIYQKSRSILYPILMHSFSNLMMVGTGYLFALLIG